MHKIIDNMNIHLSYISSLLCFYALRDLTIVLWLFLVEKGILTRMEILHDVIDSANDWRDSNGKRTLVIFVRYMVEKSIE